MFRGRKSSAMGALASLVAILWLLGAVQAAAAPKNSRWGPKYFPNYEVEAHTGERFRFYEELIENKIVLFHFIYTNCGDICPLQTARMKLVADRLGDRLGRDIFIYTVTLEPEVDTVPVLASLAEAFETPPGWLFLTGEPKQLAEIRYKLGERSKQLIEHRHEMLWIGNDKTGRWRRYSMSADLDRIAIEVLRADPEFRAAKVTLGRDYGVAKALDITKQRGRALFAKGCAACHTIGEGAALGPDLAGVTERRKRDWLIDFIKEPQDMRAKKDPVALELDAAFPIAVMPRLGLSRTDIEDVLAYIEGVDGTAVENGGKPAATTTPIADAPSR